MNIAKLFSQNQAVSISETELQRPSRRKLLLGGSAVAGAAALSAGAPAEVQAHHEEYLTLDVALDGRTFQLNRMDPTLGDQLPTRGDSFIVNGKIYPAGTIEQGLTGPDQPGSIGTWLCKGWFHVEDITQEPNVVTTQYFMLDDGNGLMSEGLEGGRTLRAIIGGYGRWGDAIGDVVEDEVEENDTLIPLGGADVPAPNIRFVFSMTPRG